MPFYLSQVIREYNVRDYDSDGHLRTRRRTEVMASNERFAPFAVEDNSGVVGIRGEGAEVDALEVVNRFENNTGTEGNFTLGGLTVHLAGGLAPSAIVTSRASCRWTRPCTCSGLPERTGTSGLRRMKEEESGS
jgi:hypothetical protein